MALPNLVRTAVIVTLAAIGTAVAAAPVPGGDPIAGQALYLAKCGGCHSLDANRIGPAHRDVVGRRIATAPGFAYSPALRKLAGVWTTARLDIWLQGPQKLAPGTKMFLIVADPVQRGDIIAYLAANSQAAPAR